MAITATTPVRTVRHDEDIPSAPTQPPRQRLIITRIQPLPAPRFALEARLESFVAEDGGAIRGCGAAGAEDAAVDQHGGPSINGVPEQADRGELFPDGEGVVAFLGSDLDLGEDGAEVGEVVEGGGHCCERGWGPDCVVVCDEDEGGGAVAEAETELDSFVGHWCREDSDPGVGERVQKLVDVALALSICHNDDALRVVCKP
ncbi:hypothetical protein MMC12_000102 [Toensbergia leucococca]|nr:hypothetical protein [Toensbergia leucococca]